MFWAHLVYSSNNLPVLVKDDFPGYSPAKKPEVDLDYHPGDVPNGRLHWFGQGTPNGEWWILNDEFWMMIMMADDYDGDDDDDDDNDDDNLCLS